MMGMVVRCCERGLLMFGFFIGLKGGSRVGHCVLCALPRNFGDSGAADRRGVVSVIYGI